MKLRLCDICECKLNAFNSRIYIVKIEYILYFFGYKKMELCENCWNKTVFMIKRLKGDDLK